MIYNKQALDYCTIALCSLSKNIRNCSIRINLPRQVCILLIIYFNNNCCCAVCPMVNFIADFRSGTARLLGILISSVICIRYRTAFRFIFHIVYFCSMYTYNSFVIHRILIDLRKFSPQAIFIINRIIAAILCPHYFIFIQSQTLTDNIICNNTLR